MEMPSVLSLCATLGRDLTPARGFEPPPTAVKAVHISELLDPTPYLSAGELLITTGLLLPMEQSGCEKYVGRLVRVGVSALAIGLGPVHDFTPSILARACEKFGLCLLQIPEPTPFQLITKAYWTAISNTSEKYLHDALATNKLLVDAAVSSDPIHSMLHVLVRALEGWAALISPTGLVQKIYPTGMSNDAELAAKYISRLRIAGVHSSASLNINSHAIGLFPLVIEGRSVGYLAVGTSAQPTPTERRLILTAITLLSLDAVRKERIDAAKRASLRSVSYLVDMGLIEAARRLSAEIGAGSVDDYMRVLVVQTNRQATVVRAVELCSERIVGVPVAEHIWFLIPSVHPSLATLEDAISQVDSDASALISREVRLRDIGVARRQLFLKLEGLEGGQREIQPTKLDGVCNELEKKIVAILSYERTDLMPTLVAYLRHGRQWEMTAKTLNVHRNTVRHRIELCEKILGTSLDDADTSAALWISLRSGGLA